MSQIEVGKPQEYFVYFKVFQPKSCGKRSAERRSRFVQRFPKPRELPEVVSLDEFKGNSGGQKYNSIVADPKNRKIVDILPNWYENDLIRYFSQFESRKNVILIFN